MNRKLLLLLSASSALLAASTTGVSWGSGYLSARFGTDQGTPAMANPYAIYYNPAALGGTKGTLLVLDASIVYRSFSYTRGADALSPTNPTSRSDANYVQANTGKGSLGNILALPFIGASSDLGTKDFRIGFASYIPFGGSTEW